MHEFHFNWLIESDWGGFYASFKKFLNGLDDNELFLPYCDDTITRSEFDISTIEQILRQNESILGFSLRLGTSIEGYEPSRNLSLDKEFFVWDWRNSMGDWGWSCDLSNTVYRTKTFKKLFEYIDERGFTVLIPNQIESQGIYFNRAYLSSNQPHLACFNYISKMGAVDLNLTQGLYLNKVQGGAEHTVEEFKKRFDEGYRINWLKYQDYIPDRVFWGLNNFELIKE